MKEVCLLLHRLGFRCTYKGFRYLCYAIELAMADETYLTRLTKGLYPDIAAHFHTTGSAVERSMRTLIEIFWQQGNQDYFEKITFYPIQVKPYPGEFIAILVCHLKSII